jgi:hypothetical protein
MKVIDFTAWPERLETTRAGLLPAVRGLVSLDLPALAAARVSRHPGHPRSVLAAVAARAQVYPDLTGLPRR